jgi:hypothetical protein
MNLPRDTELTLIGRQKPRWIGLLLILPLLVLANYASAQTTVPTTIKFDHIQTGFNLTGAHVLVPCEACHIQGVFKGTPRDCASCHMPGNRMGATAKPVRHVATIAPCDTCHRTTGWVPAFFSHVNVAPGTCLNCHNGTLATSKPNGHILTTSSCDTCHRTTAWSPAGFNHIGVLPGTCETCHNGVTAKGVGGSPTTRYPSYSGHVPTLSWISCDSCHNSTTTFLGAKVHGTVVITPGTCTSCHYRASHEGSGTQSCDKCHSTSTWNK